MRWQSTQISDIATVRSGSAFPKKYQGLTEEEYPFYKVSDMNLPGNEEKVDFANNTVSESTRRDLRSFCFPQGSIIFPKVGAAIATNKKRIVDRPGCVDNNVMGAIPDADKVDARFLFYWFQSHDLSEFANDADLPSIRKTTVENWPLRIPRAIPEQKRIVAILDKAFADIEKIRANTEQNLKNARDLFDSYLQQVFSSRGANWNRQFLGDIAEISSGGTPLKSNSDFWCKGTIPWYSSGELNSTYTIDPNSSITKAGLEGSNAKLFPKGSLLVGMYDTAALKMSILDRDGAFNQAIAGVKPNSELNLEFVLHSINYIKPALLRLRRGVRQKNLNQSKIKAIPLGLPTLDEQNEVVADLTEARNQTLELSNLYSRKLEGLEDLKKAILQKAFSGELTQKDKGVAA